MDARSAAILKYMLTISYISSKSRPETPYAWFQSLRSLRDQYEILSCPVRHFRLSAYHHPITGRTIWRLCR